MPLSGPSSPPSDDKRYFKSLEELDNWAKVPRRKFDGVLKYASRSAVPETAGSLLVCHDYKGGYTESLHEMGYTFNFWSSCSSFIYFAHHRITIPPAAWINAAHRQGVKMLGTLIFEGGAEPDCLRLLVGQLPTSKSGPAEGRAPETGLPLSPHYAVLLAQLAEERGFDGYLLNFECSLQGQYAQTHALAAWITILQSELKARIGPHAETIWYDSVIINGRLAWQDRLNSLNLPYFLSSTGFFTNYTWINEYPNTTAQYFLSLDSALTGNTSPPRREIARKSLRDIYVGVDVWGRGSHGGGGFGSYKAITHISPQSLGLSVALFGQAWSWETEQDKPGFTWEKWWEYDRKLWVGVAGGDLGVSIPDAPRKRGEPECTHGPFTPVTSFFQSNPPPDPLDLSFHTTFCPGVGKRWFVEGKKVYESRGKGWTDIDKQTSIGDLVWPKSQAKWEGGEWEGDPPLVLPELSFDDAWNAGSSLRLKTTWAGSESEIAAYRCIWIPIQLLTLTNGQPYDASIVFKTEGVDETAQLEIGFVTRPLDELASTVDIITLDEEGGELANNWTRLAIRITSQGTEGAKTQTAVGLVVALMAEDPSQTIETSILVGQINVSPTHSDAVSKASAQVLWADYQRGTPDNEGNAVKSGLLTWQIAAAYPPITSVSVQSPDDLFSAWTPHANSSWFPKFLYFDIYAQRFTSATEIGSVNDAVWIGSSNLDGLRNQFLVLDENLEGSINRDGLGSVRFYVRGVLDTGEVLSWEKSVRVDVEWPGKGEVSA
ncbi:glycoside hydrolase family 85 protein [Pluteus cervinus]|uniref:Glycoside hydrolase family 85 protein n=1 Tax=Pluteus cervinus TaxID=181527 RepID=A0ACD3AER2_9AGAR|nr:glycoside hydrolase family 85 protein [Pluteus cervinus]